MNEFRSKILGGELATRLLAAKTKRNRAAGDSLGGVTIPRSGGGRTANHRSLDRQRLVDEAVLASHRGQEHDVQLINLSGGGAMIEAAFRPELWDRVDLQLGSGQSVECAVRWLKGGRIGLEFAHETRIDADEETRLALLREVLNGCLAEEIEEPRASAPQLPEQPETPAAAPVEPGEPGDPGRRREPRHPLIWSGEIHYDHDTRPVRLRNISATGAMVEVADALPVGAELHLDLGEAGALFARVSWTCGDQVGLVFASRFDLLKLAEARPQVAPQRWTKPDYLRDESDESSPWASRWSRLSVPELRRTLKR